MDTSKLFKNYYKKTKSEIAGLVQKFINEDFFVAFPELKNSVSIVITGSAAHGMYDKESDIDLTLVFDNEEDWKAKKFLILDKYKGEHFISKIKPIELHGGNLTFLTKLTNDLESWKSDWLLREVADAIIIHDPLGKIGELKRRFVWYPEDVCKEKVNSLFAEATFLLFDRYQTGYKRKNLYYTEVVKLKIVRLFMLTLMLVDKKYPLSDKHLISDMESLSSNLIEIAGSFGAIIKKKNIKQIYGELIDVRSKIEKLLLNKNFIEEKGLDYWLGLRPVRKVEIEQ